MHPSADPTTMRRRDAEFAKAATAADVDQLVKRWSSEDAAARDAEDWRTREVAELRQRVATLERLVAPRGALTAGIGEALGRTKAALDKRITAVERKQLRYRGVFDPSVEYLPNDLCTRSGSLWFCAARTHETPGRSSAWTLVAKSGEAGKGPAAA